MKIQRPDLASGRFKFLIWCVYCTKLAPISKTNDVARSACVVA